MKAAADSSALSDSGSVGSGSAGGGNDGRDGARQRRVSQGSGASTGSNSGRLRTVAIGRAVHFGEALPARENPIPFSEAPPTPAFVQNLEMATAAEAAVNQTPLSEQLVNELKILCLSVTPQQAAVHDGILMDLHSMLSQASGVQLPRTAADSESGKLLPLGAFHLGVLTPQDQLDVVYIAPLQVQLPDLMLRLRAALQNDASITGISAASAEGVLGAPGLRFSLRGVRIKLLLTQRIPQLPQPSPAGVVQHVAGLLAREVSEKILARVPNVDQFRLLLRFIRLWAKQRGIYGSTLGFFGGTAWAICCARICQMHPHMEIAGLVVKFFRVLSRWDWRQPVAVLPNGSNFAAPCAPERPPRQSNSTGSDLTGEQKDAVSGMWVELPVGSGLSASPHVSETTAKVLHKELRRAFKRVQQVELGRAHWAEVYTVARFFQRHQHYLEFDFTASSEAVLATWLAWGQQQMQGLVQLFESMNTHIVTLRPWPEWLEYKDPDWPHARAVFIGLHLRRTGERSQDGSKRSYDMREPIVKFLEAVSSWPEAANHGNQFDLLIKHVRLHELEQWINSRQKGLALRHSAHAIVDSIPPPSAGWSSGSGDMPPEQSEGVEYSL